MDYQNKQGLFSAVLVRPQQLEKLIAITISMLRRLHEQYEP